MTAVDVVTWNLNGLDELGLDLRTEAAVQDILLDARIEAIAAGHRVPGAPPDVVLLQEVTARTFHAHLKPHLSAAGYSMFPSVPPDRSYFEILAVRPPWRPVEHRAEPLPKSQYGRWLHRLRLEGPGAECTVLTAHFDSGPEKTARAIRSAQARDVASLMKARAIFAGDTNLREREWAKLAPALGIDDAWERAGSPDQHRFTWFADERRARFDRVWVTPDIDVTGFRAIGTMPVLNAGPEAELRALWLPSSMPGPGALENGAGGADGGAGGEPATAGSGLSLLPSDHLGLRVLLRLPT